MSCELDIVFPCLDEAAALPWIMARVPANARAIVVDNGSQDGSAALATELGATVVRCAQRGYGAACHAGVVAAQAEFVAICDCDATVDPGDSLALLDAVRAGADLAVGRRRPIERGAWPLHARAANLELARRLRRRTGADIRDVGPLRLARRTALLGLPIGDRRSGYPVETITKASDAGWRIEQVDVAYRRRIGDSKVTGTWRGTVQAVRDISTVLAA
jgi:glycosyltransferase involved in cell wall biosynthesis